FKIDIFEELKKILGGNYEPVLLSPVKQEIEKLLKKGSTKTRREAAFALKLSDKCKLVRIDETCKGSLDDIIVQVALDWKCPVFTNDKDLRKRLRDINVPVIYVRQKTRLEINGG
ncbi:MAG: DNA-binding protein, partial [Candidatus Bathyarchaeia archaeon]